MISFFEYFKNFIGVLEKNNVRYVILRGYEGLPNSYSNDLDFGIHPEDEVLFFKALKTYKEKYNLNIEVSLSRFKLLKLKFIYPDTQIDFDFWFDINYCGLDYINLSEVINNARIYNNFMIPNPEDELTISFLKELLHMKRLRKDKVDWLTLKVDESNLDFFANFFSINTKEKIIKVIKDRKFELKDFSYKTKIELVKYHFRNRSIKNTILKLFLFIYIRFRNNKNPLVLKVKEI
jgi:hypothetical protein